MPENYKRKLTAILSADVEGYSRLMGEDEDATIRTLTSYMELMSTLIQKHRGRVIDSPGDNLLAEFLSVVDAVRCAVEIQEELRVRNAELPENRRMEFRIGINLGDVVEEGERIYGDGVNITARVEGLAERGGICISGTVYDSIKNKLSLGYESLGEHTVKNIKEPVRVYRMRIGPEVAKPSVREEKTGPKRKQKATLAIVAVLVVATGAWAIWNFYFRPPPIEPASVEKMAYPLPDKPSIAVLPFANMSDDPQQEYFVDGITNDIITALSEFKFIFIIASTSSFAYKGKPVKVQEVSEELGVRYVLEGSVQRTGDRMRINAQLIDATTGKHLWAELYDREAKRLFDIQDEIVETIVATMAFEVDAVERERVARKGPENLDAYDYWLRGRDAWFRWTKEANSEAGSLYQKAIELDPSWARPYCYMPWVHVNDMQNGWSENPEKSLELALEWAQKCYALDPNDYKTHWTLGLVYLYLGNFDLALSEYERALALNSNDADFLAQMTEALTYLGRSEQAIAQLKKAMRMNPRHPSWYWELLGFAYYEVGQYKEALAALKHGNKPSFFDHRNLAAVYVRLGRLEEARAEVSKLLEKNPHYTLRSENNSPYKDENRRERLINDLRKAGMPE
ncbi:MAG: adenylate/guanylate cyclase domain-containing protein [Desulfobacterales bacterium]